MDAESTGTCCGSFKAPLSMRELRILQANVRKMSSVQHAMLNDPQLEPFSVMLLQEPHCFWDYERQQVIASPQQTSQWTQVMPTERRPTTFPIRSMIYVKRSLAMTVVPIANPDLCAVLLRLGSQQILAVSLYVPTRSEDPSNETLAAMLSMIRDAYRSIRRDHGHDVALFIGGDFNRHHPLWGGDTIAHSGRYGGEGSEVVDFMHDLELSSLLPRGTITFDSASGQSTIDLALATSHLVTKQLWCRVHDIDYGSDHLPIDTAFALAIPEDSPVPRRALKSANWERIRGAVLRDVQNGGIHHTADIHTYAQSMIDVVNRALDRHAPLTKPSPYSKRWWTQDLTALRQDFTFWRNRYRAARRAGIDAPHLRSQSERAGQVFARAVRQQKKNHWVDFLDEPTNIWSAAKYLGEGNGSGFSRIPRLITAQGDSLTQNSDIAEALVGQFFPPLPSRPQTTTSMDETFPALPCPPLTAAEVKDAILKAKPWKAAGVDGLPAVVWKELWPVLGSEIVALFRRSLSTGQVPACWKVAKIIPLKKPGKADYTVAKAYRPISLLSTLGKALEAVVAERVSYLAEKHGLLPQNHFGARKRRSPIQALSTLQEHIYGAWRRRQVLSLVSFDVQGAYNGVCHNVLLQRLRSRQIPDTLVRWIGAFCSDRQASITVNEESSNRFPLPQAGLPQGSPLSPILFLFFNADLVQTPINATQGAIAFVDDYNAWVVGDTAAENTRRLQAELIPRVQQWEQESGATFEASKTCFIHFTRNTRKQADTPLHIKDALIAPSSTAKVLGVILDQALWFREHSSRASKRGIQAVCALNRLRGLRSDTARQLFTATVTPVMDYASPVWSPKATVQMRIALNQVQRLAAKSIVGVFRTTALATAEVEAAIIPTEIRWRQQRMRFWTDLRTLPDKHPLQPLQRRARRPCRRFPSALMLMAAEGETPGSADYERIEAYSQAPWDERLHVHILDRDDAIGITTRPWQAQELRIFTDGSVRKGKVGIGIIGQLHNRGIQEEVLRVSQPVASTHAMNIYTAELQAIHEALRLTRQGRFFMRAIRFITVYCDSQAALKSLARPRQQSGQYLLMHIQDHVRHIREILSIDIDFRWVPGHAGCTGNELAHQLAQAATDATNHPPPQPQIRSAVRRSLQQQIEVHRMDLYRQHQATGTFTRKLDHALPGRHPRQLYAGLNREQGSILAQLRTGRCRLNAYLGTIGAADSTQCACGRIETVSHFLLDCPRWTEARRTLMDAARPRWGDLSYLLGGWSHASRDGPIHAWRPNLTVVKATIAFAEVTKRLSREE